MDWFLYNKDLRHERVKAFLILKLFTQQDLVHKSINEWLQGHKLMEC